MAIACDSCQDGVRDPLLGDALIAMVILGQFPA